tara:strand:+ start:506 stop:1132 length:627 start_codon:yes stop_codon:yes gene_type:complete
LPIKNKILSIVPDKNNTFKITTSSGVKFRVPVEILFKTPLSEGTELSESDISELKSSKDYFKVRSVALRLLDYRMRSKKELELKLLKKGNNKNTISTVIDNLEDKGWINDEEFCLAFSRDQINRNNIGPIALKYKLKEHIDSLSLIEELSNRIYSELNIENIIMKVLVKYSPEKLKEEALKRKIINRLKRKGHYWQDIDEVLNKYLNS